jgi:NAD(P)-dependent dehydrogenase (short-subunit alcohol dehydrogenase family)
MDDQVAALFSLEGHVALVTGAATGIGEGIARMLAAAGASVAIADIDASGAERVAASIAETGAAALAVQADVTDERAARHAVERTVAQFGGIDALVNNAGSFHHAGSILDQSYATWRTSVAINFDSLFLCSKPAAEQMVAQGRGGAIVNISSVDAFLPCLGTAYDAPKGAITQFTRSLALDLAPHQIRVNAVAPGNVPVETLRRMQAGELPPLWTEPSQPTGLMNPLMRQRSANLPLGRKGTVGDIAAAVLYLCAPASAYVVGQTLIVDGGWLLI